MAKTKKKKIVKKPLKKKISVGKKTQRKKPTKVKKGLVHPPKFSKGKFRRVKKKIAVKKNALKKPIVKKKAVVKKLVKKPAKKIIKIIRKIKPVARKKKKPIIKEEAMGFPAEALFKAKIKVIGIGGGGGSIVSEIGRSLEKATFVIADTDIRALKKKNGIKYLWFGEEFTHGLGTGVNVELAKEAAESAKEKISVYFKDQDIIIFVASLGGGLGSGATQIFAEAAKEFGGITLGIFTMPFKFEGKNKQRVALTALKSLRKSLNVSLVIPNERIFKVIDESTPITNAFSTVNKSLIESLESLIDLIYNPGIINIDFADLRTILKGRGNTAFLNTVEESGKNRIEKTCENIFVNPLLQSGFFKAEKILFNIAGSEGISMFEVEKISSHISNLNPKAKIIFGISKDFRLKNKIKTTILMTSGQAKEVLPVKKVEPVKKIEPVKTIFKEPVKKSVQTVIKKGVIIANKKTVILKKEIIKIAKFKEKQTVKKGVIVPEQEKKEEKTIVISSAPVLKISAPLETPVAMSAIEQRRMVIAETESDLSKKAIRRSGLEIRKAEEMEEKKRLAQEKEWEIPAFLRKVKYKS